MTRGRIIGMVATVSTNLPALSKPQATVLGLWSFGMALSKSCGLTSVAVFLAAVLGCKEATCANGCAVASRRRRQERRPAPNLGCGQLFWAAVDLGVERLAAQRETAGLGHGRDELGQLFTCWPSVSSIVARGPDRGVVLPGIPWALENPLVDPV